MLPTRFIRDDRSRNINFTLSSVYQNSDALFIKSKGNARESTLAVYFEISLHIENLERVPLSGATLTFSRQTRNLRCHLRFK